MTIGSTPWRTPMKIQTKAPKKIAHGKLTKAERVALERLQGLQDCSRQADLAHSGMVRDPRGAFLEQGTCVVYSRDGFSSDVRARRAAVWVAGRIEGMGHEIGGFGVGGRGRTWVLVVRVPFGTRKRDRECLGWELGVVVSEVWEEVGGYEAKDA